MSFIAFLTTKVTQVSQQLDFERRGQQINAIGRQYQEQGKISQQGYEWFCWKASDSEDYWRSVFAHGDAELYWDGVIDGQS